MTLVPQHCAGLTFEILLQVEISSKDSKKNPTDPWNIAPDPQPTVYFRISFCIGGLGMRGGYVPWGFVGDFLEGWGLWTCQPSLKRAHFRPLKIQFAWKIRNIFLLWQRAFGPISVCKTLQEVPVSNRFSDGKWQLQNWLCGILGLQEIGRSWCLPWKSKTIKMRFPRICW